MNDELDKQRMKKIIGFINDDTYKPMKISDIAMLLQVPSAEKEHFQTIIDKIIKDGKAVLTKKGKLMPPEKLNMCAGTFIGNPKGFGFVITDDDGGKDVFIPAGFTNGAMHKDRVICKKDGYDSERPAGEVVRIIERGTNIVVGTFTAEKSFGFVAPDDKKMSQDIFIAPENSKGAVQGHKVVVKIIKPPSPSRNPEGKVVEILGHINDPGVDILSVIRQFELPTDFPEDVYNEAEKIITEITEKDLAGRTDLRHIKMVTIDGDDAKDLDDAVSLEVSETGVFKLGVHIADVAHYVKENSPLDKEAYKRGTSVYLVDRVIPMLPHKLSNGICSLNYGADRLALSCTMEIDKSGRLLSSEINETVINIDKRMSYNVVNDLLTNNNSEFIVENKEFMDLFNNMEKLCTILKEKRIKRGAIEFDFTESKIILNNEGYPIDIEPRERNIATSIIEEFMLMCNETVAEQFFWLQVPFLYRTHEEPDDEKMLKLSEFIHNFGYSFKGSGTHPKSLQKLIANFESTEWSMIINKVILRSLKQARYTETNEGHFGLAAKYYCHFTSPIRRYPDLFIHRVIKKFIKCGIEGIQSNKKLPEIARHCSMRERTAEEAERETDNLKKVQYMSDKVGKEFDGIISGVTKWGLYVELPNTVEGMVSVNTLDDDFYIYDEKNMAYFGERTKKAYKLGNKVKVMLMRANIYERTLDFEFLQD